MLEFPVPVEVNTLVAMATMRSVAANVVPVNALGVHVAEVTEVLGSVVLVNVTKLVSVVPSHL